MAKGATSKKKREDENRQNTQQREETRQRQQRTQRETSQNNSASSRQTTRREVAPAAIPVLEERSTPRMSASGRNVASMFPESTAPQTTNIPKVEPIQTNNNGQGFASDVDSRVQRRNEQGIRLDAEERIKASDASQYGTERAEEPQMEEYPSTTEKGRKNAQRRSERNNQNITMPSGKNGDYQGEGGGRSFEKESNLSDIGQQTVDDINKKIDRLSVIPTGTLGAVDQKMSELYDEADTIRALDNLSTNEKVDYLLDPEHRMSKSEQDYAESLFDEYIENNSKAKELYNTNDAAMSSLLAQRMTPEEAEEYARMVTLKNKTSDLGSAGLHMAQSMPFVRGLADKSMEAYEDQKGGGKKGEGSKGLDLSDYNYSAQLEQTQTQNPLASIGGNMAYQLGQYAAFAPLVEGIPVVGKAASALGGRFSNPAVAKAVESIVSGQAADTILDTLPNEIIPDLMEGNWRDLPKDIALNQLGNLAFNVLGEGAGALARNFIPSLRNADEVADTVQQNELNPVDLARQNEIDVNAKVDNVNQAVDEVNNLANQVPELPNDYRWSKPADRLIPEDSYARTDEFRQLENQRTDLHRERQDLEATRDELRKALTNEPTTPKPESEWTADDKLSSISGRTPVAYTAKGQDILNRINETEARIKDIDSQISSLDDSLAYRRANERLAQLENYESTGIAPASRNDYEGFSLDKASHGYMDYVKDGKAIVAEMSPEEYIRRCAYEIFDREEDNAATIESALGSRNQKTIENLINEIQNGTKLDAPYLDYVNNGQEGLHRALAAYELGIDKIPVVVRGTPPNASDLGWNARHLINQADIKRLDSELSSIDDDLDLLDFEEVETELKQGNEAIQPETANSELEREAEAFFSDMGEGYNGTRDWWKNTIDRANEFIYGGDPAETTARADIANKYLAQMEQLERESKALIDAGGTPTWSMPSPTKQLDDVAARINGVLDNVPLTDEKISLEADNIRKAIDNYRAALEGDSLDAITQARKDLTNAAKRFDTRAKKISLDGYDGTFGNRSFTYSLAESTGVGSPETLWKNIADAEESNRRLLSGEEQEDTLGKLLNGETLDESVKATPAVETPKAEPIPTEGGGNPPTPNEPIDLTRGPSGDLKERGTSEHIRSIEDVRVATPMKMEGVSDEVVADFVDNPDMYKVLKNADTKALADDIYNSGDQAIRIGDNVYTGDVETKFGKLLSEKNPAALPLGHQLAKDYSEAGNHDMAAQIYRRMGEELTKAGQFSQAAAINMMRNDPLTALQYAEKQLEAINQQGAKRFRDRWVDMALTEDEIKAFNNIEPGDAEAIKALYDKIGARLGREYPTTFMEKLLEGRKVAMLFNVRTNVRNFGANVPTLGMRWAADRVEALGQNIAHLIDPNFKVTQALSGSGIEGRKLATDVYNSDAVQALLKGNTGKYELPELSNSLMKDRQMFKGTALSKWINRVTDGGIEKLNKQLFDKEGVESGLETIRNATYKALDLGDRPFVKENFIERLGSYIHAQGIKRIEDVPDEAIQTAWEEAMKATYKDNSWAVEMLRGLKGGMEKIPGIGKPLSQASIPFLQAPGNIAARMVDYSPIKATKGIADIISGATNNSEKAVRQGIEEVSKGLTGTGMIILGMKLKEAGILTTDYSDDKDQKNFEKQKGFKPWALHVGDKYYTYDWAQPFAEPMIIGSLLQEAIDNSDQYDSDILNALGIEGSAAGAIIGATKEGVKASVNSWFNASPLQGMADLLKSDYSGETDVAQNIFDTAVSDFAGAFVPALVNATAKTIDPTQRNTYDPSNKVATFINQQQAKIPGLSAFLPAKYDTWGEQMNYADNSGESFLQRFLIPGDYGTESNDPIDAEINSLFENTQDNGVFPLTAANKVGDRILNNREVSAYQQDMGLRSRQLVEAFMDSDAYQNMSDIDKVATLKTLYGVSKAVTERDMFDKPLADSSTYKKAVEAYDANGIEGLMNYLQGKDIVNSAGLSTSSNVAKDVQALVESGNIEEAQELAEQASALASYGLSSKAQTAYAERASQLIPGLTPEIYAQTWESFNIDGKGDISQDDMIDFFNQNGVTNEQQALTLWKAYLGTYNEGSSKVPYLKEDGTWGKRNPEDTATTSSNNNADIMNMLSQQTSGQETTSNNESWLDQVTGNRPQTEEIPAVTGNSQPLTTDAALERIANTGIKTTAPSSYWPQAYAVDPTLTPEQFAQTWGAIDADHNGAHKKDEWVNYLNNNNLDEAGDRRLIQMYYNTGWNPLNYANGRWSK